VTEPMRIRDGVDAADGPDVVLSVYARAARELEPTSLVFTERRATAANGKIVGLEERPYSVRCVGGNLLGACTVTHRG
jgi:hypothetical protein